MDLNIHLHPKQGLMLKSPATEVFWGGAAGGGKSFSLRACAVIYASLIPNLQVFFFRRLYPDLVRSHVEGPKGFRALLNPLIEAKRADMVEGEIRFWNGSKIFLCHCKDEDDKYNYLSSEMHLLCVDELTTFSESIYRFLRSRVRCIGLSIPEEYRALFPRILCTSNPGNIGHQWVKRAFIDPAPPMEIFKTEGSEGGMLRQYIPAKLEDNPSLLKDDPAYEKRLAGMGSPRLVAAYRDGKWDILEGAFFPEFGEKHIVEPFAIDPHWTKFRCFDWGSAAPFYAGWFAVCGVRTEAVNAKGEKFFIPEGALILYKECSGESDYNVGLRKADGSYYTAEDIAKLIVSYDEMGERMDYAIADTSIFDEDGGPSIAERMRPYIMWMRADKRRVPGWDALRQRLTGDGSVPMIFFFKTCRAIIRDIPSLEHSQKKPEDAASEGVADHCLQGDVLVDTLRGQIPIEKLVGTSGLVYTSDGIKPYTNVRMTRKNAPIWKVTFSDGRSVSCTPEHRFLMPDGTYKELQHMKPYDKVRSVQTPYFNGESYARRDGIRNTSKIQWNKLLPCIGVLHILVVRRIHADTSCRLGVPSWKNTSRISGTSQRSEPQKQSVGELRNHPISSTSLYAQKAYDRISSMVRQKMRMVWNCFSNKGRFYSFLLPSAPEERLATIETIKARISTCSAYCLEVPSTGNFSVEGGIIVKNSVDAVRYGIMTRPYVNQTEVIEQKKTIQTISMNDLWAQKASDDRKMRW